VKVQSLSPTKSSSPAAADPAPLCSDLLSVESVSQSYPGSNGHDPTEALAGITFGVQDGEFVCIVGPSGCGKTTLLRILGGLLAPSAGQVCLRGEALAGPRREIGYVFQHANLMPWRSLLRNVALPLEVQGVAEREALPRARKALDLVGLAGFEEAYPRQLSGGMAQRAALARTLIHEPELLLLDEPFGALDAITREQMNRELLRVRRAYHVTAVMVTHSIQEAVFLADRVLVMSPRPGRITHEIPIPLTRPREPELLGDSDFARLAQTVRQAIGEFT